MKDQGRNSAYLLTVYEDIATPTQGQVDIFDCVFEMWLEILALEVQDIQTVALVTVLFRCGKPWNIKDLNEVVYIMFLEYGRIEHSGDGSKVKSARVRALKSGGGRGCRRKNKMHGSAHCFRNLLGEA